MGRIEEQKGKEVEINEQRKGNGLKHRWNRTIKHNGRTKRMR